MTIELAELAVCDDVFDESVLELLAELLALDRSRVVDLNRFWGLVPSPEKTVGVELVRRTEGYRLLVKIYTDFPLQGMENLASAFAVRFSTLAVIGDEAGHEDSVLIFYEDGTYSRGLDVGGAGAGEFSAYGHREPLRGPER